MFLLLFLSCTPRIVRYSGPVSGLGSDVGESSTTESTVATQTAKDSKDKEKSEIKAKNKIIEEVAVKKQKDLIAKKTAMKSSMKTEETTKESAAERDLLVSSARSFMGKKILRVGDKIYRSDCSGLVSAAYAKAGRTLTGSPRTMYAQAKKNMYYQQLLILGMWFFSTTLLIKTKMVVLMIQSHMLVLLKRSLMMGGYQCFTLVPSMLVASIWM